MATIFSHAFVAVALGRTCTGARMPWRVSSRFWELTAFCAVVPDVDVLGFAFGVQYGDVLGHRGLTHSLAFALVLAVTVVALAFPERRVVTRGWWAFVGYFFAATASHGMLDALTNGGLGVAFFSPFSNARYFFPWQPLEVSPIGAGFFSSRGLDVIMNEFVWLWLPAGVLMFGAWAIRRFTSSSG